MFDIGFPELLLVSVVALLVIGPERLPETVRSIMLWIGRIRKSFTNIKTELEREIGADEIRQQLHNETIMKELHETRDEINAALKQTDESLMEMKSATVNSIENSIDPSSTKSSTNSSAQPGIVDSTDNPSLDNSKR